MKIKVTVDNVVYMFKEPTLRMSQMAAKVDNSSRSVELFKQCLESVNGAQKSPTEIEMVFSEMKLNCFTEIARAFENNMGKFANSAIIEEIF